MTVFVDQEIRGVKYRLTRLPMRDAGRVALRVGQVLAGALEDAKAVRGLVGMLNQAKDEGGEAVKLLDLLKSDESLLAALAGGVAKLDAATLYDLGLECITGHLFGETGKLADNDAVDQYFATHQDHLFLVLAWALRVNCSGFFGKGVTVSK